MILSLRFTGTGTAFSKIGQNGAFVECGDGHILVDCGASLPYRLQETIGIGVKDVRCILPTHSHGDHIGGIEHLGLHNYYVGSRHMGLPKTKLIATEHYQQILWDQSLRGGMAYNEVLGETNERPMVLSDYFDLIKPEWIQSKPREMWEVPVDEIGFGCPVKLFRTKHIPEQAPTWQSAFPSYGVAFGANNEVVYTSDTKFDPDLLNQIVTSRTQYIFHDVQFYKGGVHTPYEDLRALPYKYVNVMHLMHYPDVLDQAVIQGVLNSGFKFASVGKTYEVTL